MTAGHPAALSAGRFNSDQTGTRNATLAMSSTKPNTHTHEPAQDAAKLDERRAYSPPRLQLFGAVGALTQAGTGMNSEAMGMMISTNTMFRP